MNHELKKIISNIPLPKRSHGGGDPNDREPIQHADVAELPSNRHARHKCGLLVSNPHQPKRVLVMVPADGVQLLYLQGGLSVPLLLFVLR